MKIWGLYTIIFALGLSGFLLMMSVAESPEKLVLGQWEEIKWEYEKADKSENCPNKNDLKSEAVKKTAGKNLVIHRAETWRFYPNGTLVLSGGDTQKAAEWRIKGRAHILQLRYDNNLTENYNISILNDKILVLNFESDLEIRGIAKLTFTKSKK